jgi:predicted nucleic-acid-binding protein
MRAIDTNLLVRLIARDDTRQAAAAESFIRGGAWVSQLVLVETVWVLTSVYGFGRTEVATAVDMLLDHRELAVQDPDTVNAALAHYRRKTPAEFSDCLILEVARKNGHLPLGTFDRRLGRLEGAQQL